MQILVVLCYLRLDVHFVLFDFSRYGINNKCLDSSNGFVEFEYLCLVSLSVFRDQADFDSKLPIGSHQQACQLGKQSLNGLWTFKHLPRVGVFHPA